MTPWRKILVLALVLIAIVCILCACSSSVYNREIVDLKYGFDYAYIRLPSDMYVKGKVDSWRDYDDSDMIQVTIDGVTYYTHGSNVVIMKGGSDG